jgi:multiple sugar transport system substrate-binding protein
MSSVLSERRSDGASRRTLIRAAGASLMGAAGVALAGCGQAGSGEGSGPAPDGTPREVLWGNPIAPSDPRAELWKETWKAAEQATGLKITLVEEASVAWQKRQTELAAGMTSVDITYNQLNWVIGGGLQGMFVDHNELFKRDKVDTKQYYKAELDSWAWKGKQGGIPFATGGETVLYNKKLFDAKGVKYPHKDWTYDEFLDACRRLNDPAAGQWAVQVNQNGIHYMMGTFLLNFGGKRLNEAKDKALYGDDPKSIQGAELNVDLHRRLGFTPTPEAIATVPSGKFPMELEMVAMEINGVYRHAQVRPAIGAQNLDFAPPPKGPGGQTASVAGNAWSIMQLSKSKDAAWKALRWTHTREGMLSAQIKAVAWPPLIWAADTPQWKEQFAGSKIAEVSRVWETGGHDLLVAPDSGDMWPFMGSTTPPLKGAFDGITSTREAMQESARLVNDLFSRRPPNWK